MKRLLTALMLTTSLIGCGATSSKVTNEQPTVTPTKEQASLFSAYDDCTYSKSDYTSGIEYANCFREADKNHENILAETDEDKEHNYRRIQYEFNCDSSSDIDACYKAVPKILKDEFPNLYKNRNKSNE